MRNPSMFYEAYRKHRTLFLSLVLLPIVGMVIAIPLVLLRAPKS